MPDLLIDRPASVASPEDGVADVVPESVPEPGLVEMDRTTLPELVGTKLS